MINEMRIKLAWIEGYLHSQVSNRTAIVEFEINNTLMQLKELDRPTCMKIKSIIYLIPEFILNLSEHRKLERKFNEILDIIDHVEML